MKIFDRLKIRNLLLFYTFFVLIAIFLMLDGVLNSSSVSAITRDCVGSCCYGACESGKNCNVYGNPGEDQMWSCRKVGSVYKCITEKATNTQANCYLSCSSGWQPCGCNLSSCRNECLRIHKNDPPGHYVMPPQVCAGCKQYFSCGCDIVAQPSNTPTPTPTTPVVTTPVVTTPVVTTPVVTTPVVTTPVVTTPVVTTPVVTTPVVTTPVVTTPVITFTPTITPLTPGFEIVKDAVDGPGPYKVNATVHFSITMTNTGSMPITGINFSDRFDASKLYLTSIMYDGIDVTRFFSVDNNAGLINYNDITRLVNDFGPGRVVRLDFYFRALASAEYTCNDVIAIPNTTGESITSRDCISIVIIRPTTDL